MKFVKSNVNYSEIITFDHNRAFALDVIGRHIILLDSDKFKAINFGVQVT